METETDNTPSWRAVDTDGDTVNAYLDGDTVSLVVCDEDGAAVTRLDEDAMRGLAAWLTDCLPGGLIRGRATDVQPEILGKASTGDPDPAVSIWEEAADLVHGDRNDGYGHPRRNFTRVAHMWTALLSDKLADGEYVTPDDVARLMVAMKLSRDVHAPKRDNRVDAIGYIIAMDRLETGK